VTEIVYDSHASRFANEVEPSRDSLNAAIPRRKSAAGMRDISDRDSRERVSHIMLARNVQYKLFAVEDK